MISLSMPTYARGGKRSLLRKTIDHKPKKDWDRISKNMYVRFDGALVIKYGEDWFAKTPGEYMRFGHRSSAGRCFLHQRGQRPTERQKFKSHRRARQKMDELCPPVREKY